MNGFDTVGMSAVSAEELEQVEGGLVLGIIFGAAFTVGLGIGYMGSTALVGGGDVKLGSALAGIGGKAAGPKQ